MKKTIILFLTLVLTLCPHYIAQAQTFDSSTSQYVIASTIDLHTKVNNKFKITFDANTGTCNINSKWVDANATYGDLPVATKANNDFVGWCTTTTNKVKIKPETVVDLTHSQTLYARYRDSYLIQWTSPIASKGGFMSNGTGSYPQQKYVKYTDVNGTSHYISPYQAQSFRVKAGTPLEFGMVMDSVGGNISCNPPDVPGFNENNEYAIIIYTYPSGSYGKIVKKEIPVKQDMTIQCYSEYDDGHCHWCNQFEYEEVY